MTMEEILTSGLAELGVPTTAAQLSQLRAYYTLLDERSKVMNLTAIEGEEATARLHFLDSAALLRYVRLSGKAAADIGSGAGFPGLVAAILAPDADITLIDSLQKRVTFQQEVCDTVGLGNVTCLAGRAEEESALRESFEVVTSRAVARMTMLCELCLPLVRVGGVFAAMKGPEPEEEVHPHARRRETAHREIHRSRHGRRAQRRYHPENRAHPGEISPPVRHDQKAAALKKDSKSETSVEEVSLFRLSQIINILPVLSIPHGRYLRENVSSNTPIHAARFSGDGSCRARS